MSRIVKIASSEFRQEERKRKRFIRDEKRLFRAQWEIRMEERFAYTCATRFIAVTCDRHRDSFISYAGVARLTVQYKIRLSALLADRFASRAIRRFSTSYVMLVAGAERNDTKRNGYRVSAYMRAVNARYPPRMCAPRNTS